MFPTQLSRRNVLKVGFLSSVVFLVNGCNIIGVTTPKDTMLMLHRDLFPQANTLNIDTLSYMKIVFHHSRIDEDEKLFLKNGVKWLNEEALKMFDASYVKLSTQKREAVLLAIVKENWGENFMYKTMSYMFEAMFGDPIYGGNNNEAGWKWLAFEGGRPRPKRAYL